MTGKIQPYHLTKQAYIYLRQSTMAQVRLNQESTQRQYALQDKAQQLGWSPTIIKILDGDLGMSGTQSSNREDFKTLVADVSMSKVGAVFALEASRLSRSCTDWHRLLELCAMTNTLIIDEDGCYNPSDFNDQLLLGLKGSMSFAELHFIRARLQGGKVNKAKKGELRFPLPVGFCYDDQGRVRLDPDEQVRHTLHLFFSVFKEKGSAYGVIHHFAQNHIQFPKRPHGGVRKGKLVWARLTEARARAIIKNPSYAGAYVYGRYTYQKKLSQTGQLLVTPIILPMEEWPIMIKDHHEAYIAWEDYVHNQKILKQNQTNAEINLLPLNAREGHALLQGLIICGDCGRRVTIRYKGHAGVCPRYECNYRKNQGMGKSSCLSVGAPALDQAISQRVLRAITPAQIEIAIQAFEELEQRNQSLEKQWLMKIKRAEYEAQLAQRRYEEVDPSNRLVAATLEKDWNDALTFLQEVQSQYTDYQKQNILVTTKEQKENLLTLAKDFPRLWNAPSTSSKDRKRMLRLLIKDITIEKSKTERKVILHMCWHGGALESLEVPIPPPSYERWRHSDEIVNRVRELALTLTDREIVEKFNQECLRTNKGNPFTLYSIEWIRFKHKIPATLPRPDELSINQAAEKFNVSHHVVRYWIERKMVNARRLRQKFWVSLDPDKEAALKKKVESSTKIAVARLKSQSSTVGGAL
ncbi:MAG: recombinase family protein [Alphaproteobacteria bacterium]|nr:recombinase family protein [Alphaproteobacteria bacterium]